MTVSILESPAVEKPVRCKPWLYFAALPLHASAASSWPPVQNCPTPRRTIWRRRSPRCFGEAQLLAPTSVRYAGNETISAIVYRRIAISTLQKRKRVHRRDAPTLARQVLEFSPFHKVASLSDPKPVYRNFARKRPPRRDLHRNNGLL